MGERRAQARLSQTTRRRGRHLESTFTAGAKRVFAERGTAAVQDDSPSTLPAAVLLALHAVDGEICVVLQKRSQLVEHHKGEISFPGGMADAEDESRLATALREAQEEMGIRPEDVDIIGRLDDSPTITGFMISTFVGAIPAGYEFTPSDVEVESVIQAPLSHLRNPKSRRWEARLRADGSIDHMPAFSYGGEVVFGATARILDQFLTLTADIPL